VAVHLSLRYAISSGGILLTVAATGAATAPVSDVIAGPSTCTITRSSASSSVVCLPGVLPSTTAGQPSAEDLTYQNMVRSRGGGLL
jgi:hypothetical protein